MRKGCLEGGLAGVVKDGRGRFWRDREGGGCGEGCGRKRWQPRCGAGRECCNLGVTRTMCSQALGCGNTGGIQSLWGR